MKPQRRIQNLAKLALYDWDLEIIDKLAIIAFKFRSMKLQHFTNDEKRKLLSIEIKFEDWAKISSALMSAGFSKLSMSLGKMIFNYKFNNKTYVISLESKGFTENNFIITKNLLTG